MLAPSDRQAILSRIGHVLLSADLKEPHMQQMPEVAVSLFSQALQESSCARRV